MGVEDKLVRDFERENHVLLDAEKQVGKKLVENIKCFWFFYNTNQINCGRTSFIIHFPFS